MKPVYIVKWEDSETEAGWPGEEEMDKGLLFPLITSIGFLVKENKKGIVLAISWDAENKRGNPVIFIPRRAIVEKWELDID